MSNYPNPPPGIQGAGPPVFPNSDTPHPPFHAGPPLGQELGTMFGFACLFPLTIVIYYYVWLLTNEWEARREWLRREKLRGKNVSWVEAEARGMYEGEGGKKGWRWGGAKGEGERGTVLRGLGVVRGGGKWSERWRESGVLAQKEREEEGGNGNGKGKGKRWGPGMVMSTGAGHGGGEVP